MLLFIWLVVTGGAALAQAARLQDYQLSNYVERDLRDNEVELIDCKEACNTSENLQRCVIEQNGRMYMSCGDLGWYSLGSKLSRDLCIECFKDEGERCTEGLVSHQQEYRRCAEGLQCDRWKTTCTKKSDKLVWPAARPFQYLVPVASKRYSEKPLDVNYLIRERRQA